MDPEFSDKFTSVMANFFSRMFQGLENLTVDGVKIKDGIILLNFIHNYELVSMSDVKNFLDTNPSTATRRVDHLVDHGLVERVSDSEDRRAVLLNLTSKGLAVHSKFFASRTEMLGRFMEHITEEEATTFLGVIEKFLTLTDDNLEFKK